ncbi:MAG TPA: ATP-binding protein [Vicinamibacterales bacterium]
MRDTRLPPDLGADAEILGRLLLVQTTLHVMPKLDGMGEFLCQGLCDVPGVRGAAVCIGGRMVGRSETVPECEHLASAGSCDALVGQTSDSPCRSCPLAGLPGVIRLPFTTIIASYGWLVVFIDDAGRFAPYAPHVQNLVSLFATIVENRHQHGQLVEGRRLLEQKVQERTLELIRVNEDLAQSRKLESIGRLAGGIAHDFNNLLTAILGYTELAEDLAPSAATADCLREIRGAGERAAALTRQLLAFARRQVVAPKPVSPNALIDDLAAMLRRLIGEHIQLVVRLDPCGWRVLLDPGQFSQLLTNLAVNARDAMPRGGSLTVQTEGVSLDEEGARRLGLSEAGDYLVMTVADTGSGMADEVKVRAFEPFFTTKAVGHGTGLGLSTCYGIVKQNGGHIRLESEPGQGTVFTIYLPRTGDEDRPVVECRPQDDRLRGHETVLVAEDESAIRRLAAATLRAHGYHVLEAANGQEALDVLASHRGHVDVLITDVVMPEMGAQELVARLQTLGHQPLVLFVSGYPDAGGGDTHGSGAAFLAKPFVPMALLRKVRDLLARPPQSS